MSEEHKPGHELIVYNGLGGVERVGLVDPFSGELVDLTSASVDELVSFRDRTLDAISVALREARAALDEELMQRMRRAATWTLNTETATVRANVVTTHYRADEAGKLRSALEQLAADGLIDSTTLETCAPLVVAPQPKPGLIRKLHEMNPGPVRDALAPFVAERSRRVSVEHERPERRR